MKKVILISFTFLVVVFFLFLTTGFGFIGFFHNWLGGDPAIPKKNEIVMPPMSTIEAKTRNGKIIIKSEKGLRRYYTWNSATRHVIMIPRQQRWYGSLGLYYPGTGFHWIPTSDGVKRGVLQEGHQYFVSIDEAMKWIKKQVYWGGVYRDDGLLVQLDKSGKPIDTLSVEVWQIFINGKKPKQLIGSKNDAIKTSWDSISNHPPKGKRNVSKPKTPKHTLLYHQRK